MINDQQINILVTLALLWSLVMLPMITVWGIVQFMDFMRRLKDGMPW